MLLALAREFILDATRSRNLPAVSLAVEVDFSGEGVDLGGQRVGVGLALGGLGVVDGRDLGAQLG